MLSQATREHVRRRLQFAIGRFAPRLSRVTVRVDDVNGPRGGVDKICRITVALPTATAVVVEDADRDLYAAVDRAAERLGRAVERRLSRRREVVRTVELGSEAW